MMKTLLVWLNLMCSHHLAPLLELGKSRTARFLAKHPIYIALILIKNILIRGSIMLTKVDQHLPLCILLEAVRSKIIETRHTVRVGFPKKDPVHIAWITCENIPELFPPMLTEVTECTA